MTAPAPVPLLERRPACHPDVVLGPALRCGPRTVHLVRHRGTDRGYEIGVKEHFVLERLDGDRTLADIGTEYARTFGRRLAEGSWQQLLALLAGRNLLAGTDRPEQPPAPQAQPPAAGRTGPLRGEVVFGDPTALLERAHRRLGFLFSAYFMLPLLALIAGMEVVLALHADELWHNGTRALRAQPELAMLAFSLVWASTGLHELAHGLTCRRFGGRATEVGMRWNLPLVYMYCKADDVLLFPNRWHRVAAASAGVVANLVFLLPFFPLWLCLPSGDVTRDCVGAMLLIGSVKGLLNYLPLPQLDGYAMLCHALRTTRLSTETARYLLLFAGTSAQKRQLRSAYPPRARAMYLGYVVVFTATVCVLAVGALALVESRVPAQHRTLAAVVFAAIAASMLAANLLRARFAARHPAG
jgi:putative peptide zinc metalloprotease protein